MNKVILCALLMSSTAIYTKDLKKRIEDDPLIVPMLIIGSGPAGYSAGIYARLAGIPTLLIAGPLWGGQLTKTTFVENYPGVKNARGITIPETMHEQAIELGVEMQEDIVTEVDLTTWPFVVRLASGTEAPSAWSYHSDGRYTPLVRCSGRGYLLGWRSKFLRSLRLPVF